jgi:hypothetical protein
MFGMKIQHDAKLRQIHEVLLRALSGGHQKTKQAG